MKKNNEIKGLETQELKERIEAEVSKYQHMLLSHSITPLENNSLIKAARRNIARLKTELRQRELNK